MHRSNRRTVTRLVGWAVALALYATCLVFATHLTSATEGSAPVERSAAAVSQVAAAGPQAESPLMAILLAAAAAGGIGAWRLVRLTRGRPRPAPMRPVGRRVITPT